MKAESNNNETKPPLHMNVKEIVMPEKDASEKPVKKNYFSGLKKYFHRYWPTIKSKLNEDVKIEYTGVGGEAFIEMGKKIKKRFLQNATVMVL
ncbi:MAG: hypothetical protein L3J52_06770, partial [Proteobacteria bacterium]|nr:hypothetical protein [Pseudomonadota bacterium]